MFLEILCFHHVKTMTISNALSRLFMAVMVEDAAFRDVILSFIAQKKVSEYFGLFQSDTWKNFKDEHPELADEIITEFLKKIG